MKQTPALAYGDLNKDWSHFAQVAFTLCVEIVLCWGRVKEM